MIGLYLSILSPMFSNPEMNRSIKISINSYAHTYHIILAWNRLKREISTSSVASRSTNSKWSSALVFSHNGIRMDRYLCQSRGRVRTIGNKPTASYKGAPGS